MYLLSAQYEDMFLYGILYRQKSWCSHCIDGVVESDISRADGVQRNPGTTRRLLRSYARHQGAQATTGTIKADMTSGNAFEISDKSKLECDAVVHLRNGSYGLIEIKLGGESLIADGVKTLNRLAQNINTTKMKVPAFKMILTATGNYAYRMKDNDIFVVPIGCLKP